MIVAATVLVHDNQQGLAHVMRCLARQTRRPDVVVLIDNASVEPVEIDSGLHGLVLDLERCTHNLGVGAGHNRAVRRAIDLHGADLVWVLEHDTFPDDVCLARLLEERESVGEHVVVPHTARNGYERSVSSAEKVGVVDVDVLTFNGPLLSRTILEAVGPINEEFFVGQEDFEFSSRLRQAGFRIVHVADAVVLHAHRGAQRFDSYVSPTRLYYSTRNLTWSVGRSNPVARARGCATAIVKSIAELVRPGRGLPYARARWFAHLDGRAARLGPTRRRF